MPISKSAKKALRVAQKKTSINHYRKALVKDALKAASVSTPSAETMSKAVSAVDKAAKWGIIHPNKAARLKSSLSKQATAPAAKTASKKPATKKTTKAKKTSK